MLSRARGVLQGEELIEDSDVLDELLGAQLLVRQDGLSSRRILQERGHRQKLWILTIDGVGTV